MILLCFLLLLEGSSPIADHYQAHIRFLADDHLDGRETSFQGQKIAARYLATQLALYGVQPMYPEAEDGYFQPFKVFVTGPNWTKSKLTARGGGKLQTFDLDRDLRFVIRTQSSLSASGGVVFGGYGIKHKKYDDYDGIQVKNQWLVLMEGQPSSDRKGSLFSNNLPERRTFLKVSQALDMEPAGVIVLRRESTEAPRGQGPPHDMSFEHDHDTEADMRTPIIILKESAWPKLFGKDMHRLNKALDAITASEQPQSFKLRRRKLDLKLQLDTNQRETENVIGLVRGSDAKLREEYVVISAHYDHIGHFGGNIYNGADDNGSGTATVLLLAKHFTKHPPRRSVLFLWPSGEEVGLLGSKYFVENPVVPLDQIVANINMDMIGRKERDSIGVIPSKVKGVSTLNTVFEKINDRRTAPFKIIKDMDRYHTRSDHYSFVKNDIPAVFLFAGVHDHYHSPDDDWQLLDYEKLSNLYGLLVDFVAEVGNTDQRPQFKVSAGGAAATQ